MSAHTDSVRTRARTCPRLSPPVGAGFLLLACGFLQEAGRAERFEIDTGPGGVVTIEISHIDPGGSLVTPSDPESAGFRPPAVFSAPLPSGSGARALGLAGAFTAVADDATAASWNPAGLVQLERPEASFVCRYERERHRRGSGSEGYLVGEDTFDSVALNYLSAVMPFRLLDRNFVFSANYQEAYDFEQRFHARNTLSASRRVCERSTATYREVQVDHFEQEDLRLDVTSHITTRKVSVLDQVLDSGLWSSLEFEQEGVIDALTPALAVEIRPGLAVGAALNVYQDNTLGGRQIRSSTRATYDGDSLSSVSTEDQLVTAGWYTYEGVAIIPGGQGLPALEIPISGSGGYEPFGDSSSRSSSDQVRSLGLYEEINTYEELEGLNATIGALWTVSRHASLGFTLELPWSADAEQTKTIRNTVTTYDRTGSQVLDCRESETVQQHGVTFDFPLYWALGGVWRWNNRLHSTMDVSQTLWSDFSFQAEGEARTNPLDGSAYGQNPIDDCWAVRCGTEYLWVLKHTEIPLRGGLSWEQRPAIGAPDQFWGVSLGSGISIGEDPGRLIFDVAYTCQWGHDVLGSLVSGQPGITTDVTSHEVFASCIWHF